MIQIDRNTLKTKINSHTVELHNRISMANGIHNAAKLCVDFAIVPMLHEDCMFRFFATILEVSQKSAYQIYLLSSVDVDRSTQGLPAN